MPQRDRRAAGSPSPHSLGRDDVVACALEDQRRNRHVDGKGIVLPCVRHEPPAQVASDRVAVVKHLVPVALLPLPHAIGAELLLEARHEVECGREKDKTANPRVAPAHPSRRGMQRDKGAQARAHESDRRLERINRGVGLIDHAGDGQGMEIRLVQIRADECQPGFGRPVGDEPRLRRTGRGREAVQVDDAARFHNMCWQPGRQRHGISASPVVL